MTTPFAACSLTICSDVAEQGLPYVPLRRSVTDSFWQGCIYVALYNPPFPHHLPSPPVSVAVQFLILSAGLVSIVARSQFLLHPHIIIKPGPSIPTPLLSYFFPAAGGGDQPHGLFSPQAFPLLRPFLFLGLSSSPGLSSP